MTNKIMAELDEAKAEAKTDIEGEAACVEILTRHIDDSLGVCPFNYPISKRVWELKYRRRNELDVYDTLRRVAQGLHSDNAEAAKSYAFMATGLFMPGGRVLAGAGLPEHTSTLMNCYVMGSLPDSLDGIMHTLQESATVQKYGGGIGIDFTPLRPKGAEVSTAAYFAGGPVAFMGLWDAMGHALESGGNRRGGKMATMYCTHPDIVEFIGAKTKEGKLTSFNISVTVSDAFMAAVEANEDWVLYHTSPRIGERKTQEKIVVEAADGKPENIEEVFVWARMPARELWEKITATTYQYSEPGVIFIDRMNKRNPLYYLENIRCTNPCGEQPLPPYGACNLGAINLALIVKNPFKEDSEINYELLEAVSREGVRILDRVLDVTKYPLYNMGDEAFNKRRIGLGITGLGDMLALMGVPYSSKEARSLAGKIMSYIAECAYDESANLAQIHGSFPSYSEAEYLEGDFFSWPRISRSVIDKIGKHGIRNGVLLTIAPTGTTSALLGDVSGGCEPIFSHKTIRRIKVKDDDNNDTWQEHITYSYTVRMYARIQGISEAIAYQQLVKDIAPDIYKTAQEIDPKDHVSMQASLQEFVDSSISKTINVPKEMDFLEFKEVYMQAFRAGSKGCTTYRPSEMRGAVLINAGEDTEEDTSDSSGSSGSEKDVGGPAHSLSTARELARETGVITQSEREEFRRGEVLFGSTYKIRWPGINSSLFLTINNTSGGKPIEVFIASKNAQFSEWAVGMSVIISKLLQSGVSADEVGEHLKEITLSHSGAWIKGRHYGSIVAYLGELLANHQSNPLAISTDFGSVEQRVLAHLGNADSDFTEYKSRREQPEAARFASRCSFCGSLNLYKEEGCMKCSDCNQSKCD